MTYLIVSYVCMANLTLVVFGLQTHYNLKKRKEIYDQCYSQWTREGRHGEFEKNWLYERYEHKIREHNWETSGWMTLVTVFSPIAFPVAVIFGIIAAILGFGHFILRSNDPVSSLPCLLFYHDYHSILPQHGDHSKKTCC